MASPFDYDLDPVSFITVGTQGPPGRRAFFLQAAQGSQVVSLLIEKEQAMALAAGLEQLLHQVREATEADPEAMKPTGGDMSLLSPINPTFRVAQMGIGVDEARERIVLIAEEYAEPDDEEDDEVDDDPLDIASVFGTSEDEETEGQRARFTATFSQMAALSEHALSIAGQGRPTCPLCGEPMDPKGHFCPRTNGHQHTGDD